MNRPIKFRAWDNLRKEMCYEVDVYGSSEKIRWTGQWRFENGDKDGFFDDSGKGNVLMQFTGLLDKHGKEIFEKNILCIQGKEKSFTACVMYSLTYMGYCLCNPTNLMEVAKYDDGSYIEESALCEYVEWGCDKSPRIEVIGDIYSNPELLH